MLSEIQLLLLRKENASLTGVIQSNNDLESRVPLAMRQAIDCGPRHVQFYCHITMHAESQNMSSIYHH